MRGHLDRKRVGAAKLAARQKRIATIRARVAACSVLIFAALWFAVFFWSLGSAPLIPTYDQRLVYAVEAPARAA